MTTADIALTLDQESALRESNITGEWHPQDAADRAVAGNLARHGLFTPAPSRERGRPRYYLITPAGTDWLQVHPEVS
jgi:hypothetical protein